MSNKWLLLPMLFILFAAAACGANNGAQNQEVKSYDADGYLGLSNSNPNLQTSPTYHTYQEDIDLMRNTLRRFAEVRRSNIVINGPMVYVTLKVDGDLPSSKVLDVEDRARKQLSRMMPRYTIKVMAENDSSTK